MHGPVEVNNAGGRLLCKLKRARRRDLCSLFWLLRRIRPFTTNHALHI